MTFVKYIKERVGPNWVVAARLTERLKRKYGSTVVVVTPRHYARLRRDWEDLYALAD